MRLTLTPIALLLSSLSAPLLAAECTTPFIAIHDIQGPGDKSPKVGTTLTTRGVVLAVLYADSKNPQLLLGSITADQNPLSSEALLVTDSQQAKQRQAGDVIQLTGTVREMAGMTALTNITQAEYCSRQPLPAATALTLPVASPEAFEALEGMLLSFAQPLIVNDSYGLSRYGELVLANERLPVATEVALPGDASKALMAKQALQEITIDDASMKQNPQPVRFPTGDLSASNTVRVGDTVNKLQGYLLQTKVGYRVVVSQQPEFVATNPRPAAPAAKKAGELRVASFNVLNFFTGEGNSPRFPTKRGATDANELQRQQAKMLAALAAMDADVIGLLEVENNGFGPGSALATIVQSLNQQLGSEVYAFVQPSEKPGSDDIMVAMIYRRANVEPIGTTAVYTKAPFDKGSRPPLAQSFRDLTSKQQLTVSINHFKSKGSCPKQAGPDSDLNDGQGCWTPTRVAAAKALTEWLKTEPTGIDTDYVLVMGDLNAYRKEAPLQYLEQNGWQHLAPKDAVHSSFVYRGRSGTLDHALASSQLKAKLQQFHHWGINADEPAVLDYNTEFKSKAQQQSLYAPTPYRSSDHDPLYMDFKF
ncbi:ExeM/NucH family extracellular endonuclease [Rheinheimera sp.]|uniref:ExeM/NucH family extracellular endonuclease n=1 Tax=Rheinheimera sp. TaxID=1869214 RepID=UPI003D2E541E